MLELLALFTLLGLGLVVLALISVTGFFLKLTLRLLLLPFVLLGGLVKVLLIGGLLLLALLLAPALFAVLLVVVLPLLLLLGLCGLGWALASA